MASNQTSYYGLNQWEATDQVLRTEFNADNQKIDAALHNKLGHSEFIKEISIPTGSRSIMIDLSEIDWNDWETVTITFPCMDLDSLEDPNGVFQFSLVSMSSFSTNSEYFFLKTDNITPFQLTLLPYHNASRKVLGVAIGAGNSLGVGKDSFEKLTQIQVTMPSLQLYLQQGLYFSIWGTK